MTILPITALGDAETGRNIIDERFAAESLRAIRGIDCGVLNNSFYSPTTTTDNIVRQNNPDFIFPLTYTTSTNIVVGRGIATAYGYDIKNDSDVVLSISAPVTGVKYAIIYLEWDMTDPNVKLGKIDIYDNGAATNWNPIQQNIITILNGKYQMPLYQMQISTTGTISNVQAWSALGVSGNIVSQTKINGTAINVNTIAYSLYANNCQMAEVAKLANVLKNNDTSYVKIQIGTQIITMNW